MKSQTIKQAYVPVSADSPVAIKLPFLLQAIV